VLADGQLDECELTQRDLRLMADAFVDTLLGLYRARPEVAAPLSPHAARAMPPLRVLSVEAPTAEELKRAGKP
jgi:hypothetical protein